MEVESVLVKSCMDSSVVREVMADHAQMAFGTPMFSQRPDAGYFIVLSRLTHNLGSKAKKEGI